MKKLNKFYTLKRNLKYSFNQLDLPEDYDSDGKHSIYQLGKSDYRSFKLDISELEIKKELKRTDILNDPFTTNCKVVSERTKKILEDFKLPNHRFFPFKLKHGIESHPYYFFYIDFDILDYIDYSKSTFYCENEYNEEHVFSFASQKKYLAFAKECRARITNPVQFKFQVDKDGIPTAESYKDYYEFRRHNFTYIHHKKLVLFKDLAEELDLFKTTNFYISDRLRNALIEHKITGVTIQDANKIAFSDLSKPKNTFSIKALFKNRFFD
jgi:hypothetical protein